MATTFNLTTHKEETLYNNKVVTIIKTSTDPTTSILIVETTLTSTAMPINLVK
jgi:hypothetical protein